MTLILVICIFLIFIYISLLLYYRAGWKRIPDFMPAPVTSHTTQISIIIPARNEVEKLPALLRSLALQTYPTHLFEVLVVDDFSEDGTTKVVQACANKNTRLISLEALVGNSKINSYKKKAIECGILESNGNLIVTVDADCDAPQKWLQTLAAFYEMHHPAFIAAPVTIHARFKFIEIFQSLDFMTLQGITGASVYNKTGSMCNGANMAYEKAAFYEVGGFKGIESIASGDDMLLMHKIYKRYPQRVMFLKSKDAIMHTAPVESVRAFFNQRIRWASKAEKYDDNRILPVLLVVYFLNSMLMILPLISFFYNVRFSFLHFHFSLIGAWLLMMILKTISELFFLLPVAAFFSRQSLLWLFPLMQPFHIIYTVIAGFLGKYGTYHWKGRSVK